ncbi:Poly-beta-1,6-N-acetyl-D-glucosamine synthase [Pelotomaculum sp. FP]|uniref:glycosyltransferase n=1 Tax=Pelotomaculum sp. FP TaxID=261474 RepID=UPI001066781A|nr:glycosyltransferase [Pelotomaculum sp. FP]TEB16824.1 Poly-beta-1,6-N-acetyl-D-glucosamine synthase [Pelotomaculum sp. FP]
MQTLAHCFKPDASIIIPCKNEGDNVKMTVDSLMAALPSSETEIIVVDDLSQDDCCRFLQADSRYAKIQYISLPGLGAAQARNYGAAAAKGEYLVFCDAHITVQEGWLASLLNTFNRPGVDAVSPAIGSIANPDAVGYGQTWNARLETAWLPVPARMETTRAPLLPGGCLAVHSSVFQQVGGFDRGFIVWGHEDVELSLKLWLFGYGLYINPAVKILHLFRQKHPYRVTFDYVHYNLLRMAYSHFNNNRVDKVIALVKPYGKSERIIRNVLKSGVLDQRQDYYKRRQRDDDWFMSEFQIPF